MPGRSLSFTSSVNKKHFKFKAPDEIWPCWGKPLYSRIGGRSSGRYIKRWAIDAGKGIQYGFVRILGDAVFQVCRASVSHLETGSAR